MSTFTDPAKASDFISAAQPGRARHAETLTGHPNRTTDHWSAQREETELEAGS
jgi:hypothetical protein